MNSEPVVKDIVRAEKPIDREGLVRVRGALADLEYELSLPQTQPKPEPLPTKLAGAIFMCFGAVIGGLVISAQYAKQVSILDQQRKQMDLEAANIARSAQLGTAEARDLMRYSVLSKQGVPLVGVIDEIARALPAGVGLSTVVINRNGMTRIEGEAKSEQAMLQTLDNLKHAKSLKDLRIIGFRRDDEKQLGGRFAFGATCITMSDVRIGGKP